MLLARCWGLIHCPPSAGEHPLLSCCSHASLYREDYTLAVLKASGEPMESSGLCRLLISFLVSVFRDRSSLCRSAWAETYYRPCMLAFNLWKSFCLGLLSFEITSVTHHHYYLHLLQTQQRHRFTFFIVLFDTLKYFNTLLLINVLF